MATTFVGGLNLGSYDRAKKDFINRTLRGERIGLKVDQSIYRSPGDKIAGLLMGDIGARIAEKDSKKEDLMILLENITLIIIIILKYP